MARESTEDVVDRIAGKPSVTYTLLLVGLMSFNTICALVAYFPNFGGYLPYTQWRCAWDSGTCYARLTNYSDTEWSGQLNQTLYLDQFCGLWLGNISKANSQQIEFLGTSMEALGTLEISKGVLDIKSTASCGPPSKCETKIDIAAEIVGVEKCLLEFSNPGTEDNVLRCGSAQPVNLDQGGVVEALQNASIEIRNVRFGASEGYRIRCPNTTQYNKDKMCGDDKLQGALKSGTDFVWDLGGRSYFSVDWDLQCNSEWLVALIGSIYFGGAFLGTLGGGALFDIIGRKLGALLGYALVAAATFAAAACPNIGFLLACRFLQGVGVFVGFTGMYVLLLEYTASGYRSLVNSGILMCWAVGYLLTSLIGYTVYSWHWNSAITGFAFFVTIIPLILVRESPRFLLVSKDNEAAAIANLEWLARLNGVDLDGSTVELTDREQTPEKQPTFLESLQDFWQYKELLLQVVVQMWIWMVSGFVYYGFSFSWSKLSSNMYVGYLLAAVGEVIAYVVMVPMLEHMGRKAANITFFFVGAASFLVAIIQVNLGSSFTLEQLSCLLGSMAIAAVFGSIYLYTMELAPTSHRGKILGYCSFAARIGAFCGPQAPLIMAWSKPGALIIFACLAASAGLAIFRLPDTKGIATPSSAAEVAARRKGGDPKSTVCENSAIATKI